jgi:CelD/BcsL family acetyltransferase involved in cellulose biosynthesis
VWKVELPSTWEEYLSLQSKSHRKQLRRAERRLLEHGRACWHPVRDAEGFASGWETLVDLHQRRRRSLGEPGCFASRPFSAFQAEAARHLLHRGQLRLSWLSLDDHPIAAEYHLASSAATFAYQGGVDPERLGEEPGRLSHIACIRAAIDEGHTTFDFLRGDEPYKAHWRAEPHATFDYRIVPNRRLARLRGRAVQAAGNVACWLKPGSNAFSEPAVQGVES